MLDLLTKILKVKDAR